MLVVVVVPTEAHWRAFLMNLLDLWQYTAKDRRSVTIGPIQYIGVNVQFAEHAYGLRANQIIDYNCYEAIRAGELSRRDFLRCMHILSRNGAQVITLDD